MQDLAHLVATVGDRILGNAKHSDHVGDLLQCWLRDCANVRLTTVLIVPDRTTQHCVDGRNSIEADLVCVDGGRRQGIRILVRATAQGAGWKIDEIDVHAPTVVALGGAELAIGQVLDEHACHPLADLVAEIIEALSDEGFSRACGHDGFRRITGCDVADVDTLWISADRHSMRGSADGWSIDVRLGVDSDCGKADHHLVVSGALSLGVTRFDSVTTA